MFVWGTNLYKSHIQVNNFPLKKQWNLTQEDGGKISTAFIYSFSTIGPDEQGVASKNSYNSYKYQFEKRFQKT